MARRWLRGIDMLLLVIHHGETIVAHGTVAPVAQVRRRGAALAYGTLMLFVARRQKCPGVLTTGRPQGAIPVAVA